MGVNRWCMQCATDPNGRREVPAVGVDEDGEPACYHHATMHSVRKAAGKPDEPGETLAKKQVEMRARHTSVCSYPGCGKTIAPWNRSQRCAKHRGLVGLRLGTEQLAPPEPAPPVELQPPPVTPIGKHAPKDSAFYADAEPTAGRAAAEAELRKGSARHELRELRAKLAGQIEAIDRVLEMLA